MEEPGGPPPTQGLGVPPAASCPGWREAPAHVALTLHVPCPPDGVVEPNLVPPLELQALELLPLWRHQLPTERQEQEGKLSGPSENAVKPKSATQSFQVPKFWMNPLQATGFLQSDVEQEGLGWAWWWQWCQGMEGTGLEGTGLATG